MDNYKEIKLKVKIDSYQTFRNYMHNELKITKEDMTREMEKILNAIILKQLDNGELRIILENKIEKVVHESLARLSQKGTWNLKEKVDEFISKALLEVISKHVKEQIGNISIKDLLK